MRQLAHLHPLQGGGCNGSQDFLGGPRVALQKGTALPVKSLRKESQVLCGHLPSVMWILIITLCFIFFFFFSPGGGGGKSFGYLQGALLGSL